MVVKYTGNTITHVVDQSSELQTPSFLYARTHHIWTWILSFLGICLTQSVEFVNLMAFDLKIFKLLGFFELYGIRDTIQPQLIPATSKEQILRMLFLQKFH